MELASATPVEELRSGDVILSQELPTKILDVANGPAGVRITYYDPQKKSFEEMTVPPGLMAAKLAQPAPYEVLYEPLTPEQIKERMDEDGYIQGIIAVDFGEIMDSGFEKCLDLISELLVGDDLLSDFHYQVVGHESNTLHVYVCGDANMCVDDEDKDEGDPGAEDDCAIAV